MSPSQPTRGATSSPTGAEVAPRARLRRVLILAVSVAVSVWLWHWVSTDDEGNPIVQPSDEPTLVIDNLQSFLVRRDGQPLWELKARHVSLSADRLSTVATGVNRSILYRDGKPFLHVSANKVHLSNATNDLIASGTVSASGPDGFSFETSRAFWSNGSKTVSCPKNVVAHLKGLIFETKSLTYDWVKGIMSCPDSVEVRAPGAVLRGKRMEATLKTRQIKLSGGVEMVFDPKALKIPPAR